MANAVFRTVLSALALSATIAAVPASAQFKRPGYAFLEAVKEREGNEVEEAIKSSAGVVVDARDSTTGETALHIVTRDNDSKWVTYLRQKGANPNIANNKGETPLQLAATFGYLECAEQLIKAGAEVDRSSNTGETPLISAVHNRNAALIRLLLANGADADRSDNSGRSARDYAALQTGNTQTLLEFRRADEKADKTKKQPTYGPSF